MAAEGEARERDRAGTRETAAQDTRDAPRDHAASSASAEERDAPARGSLVRRVRLSLERTRDDGSRLAETIFDPIVVPPSSFAATAVAWITTLAFFLVSLVVAAGLALGALVLFVFLELLALLAYAYPGMLFLLSVAGAVVPVVIAYWALHASIGIDAPWTTWAPFALIAVGLWGSYYYWRFGRVISTTGESVLAVYRGAAPRAKEIFGAPLAVLAVTRDVIATALGVFHGVAGELFTSLRRKFEASAGRSGGQATDERADGRGAPTRDGSSTDDPGSPEDPERDR